MKMIIHASDRTYFVGYYMGPNNISPHTAKHFDNLGQAMLFVKAKLDYFLRESYGFAVFTDEKVKEGRHMVPKILLNWHRDGQDCHGEIVNPETGWRIYIDANNQIAEEHFTPKEN